MACGILQVIRWGKQKGKQRFRCLNCHIHFTGNDSRQTQKNRFIWFQKWIRERATYRTLIRDSGLSKASLQRLFYHYLPLAPQVKVRRCLFAHLRIDATYFRSFCVMAYQDHTTGYTQLIRFSTGEYYEQIYEDLRNLEHMGVQVASITCDGHRATLKAIRNALPNVRVQRRLVHIQRMCLLWRSRYPRHEAGLELRGLVLQVLKIKTHNDRLYWCAELQAWYRRHETYLKEKTINEQTGRYWYRHKKLRRSFFTIRRALPNMFHYLDDVAIPSTTNGIEGFFSHLKNHLDLHRGLTLQHRKDFIKWYIYLSNRR